MDIPTVQLIAEKWYTRLPFPPEYNVDFKRILNALPRIEPVRFSEYNWQCYGDNQSLNLVMVLYFLEELKTRYDEAEIPEDIFWETIKDIPVYTKRTKEMTGAIGIKRLYMSSHILAMRLFRLGRLQFCMEPLSVDVPEKNLSIGTPVLDLHITEDAPLDIALCKESFATAKAFFQKYFPDYRYQYFTCHSWLMDESLARFLHENSNILKFQKLFEIFIPRESDSILNFLFKYGLTDREEIRPYPATSDFSRKVKEHALSGGTFYTALGIRNKNEQ